MKGSKHTAKRAKKSLGQNFLVDETIIERIVDALDIDAGDRVIEIGPGRGALTDRLVNSNATVAAIELDRDLIGPLRERYAGNSAVQILEQDALTVKYGEVWHGNTASPAKLVANLPYYISTPILQVLADQRPAFSRLVLMFQREVAERIAAEPGSSARGFMTVLVEAAFEVEHLFDVPPTAFEPMPKVWSSVIRLIPKSSIDVNEHLFRTIVSAGFVQKRKTILNNLKLYSKDASTLLETAQIESGRRAETLSLEEWIRLSNAFEKHQMR
ncbi:MAG: ribosomal RNA small subunit methyltransferase A [Blastocatellia bacterium]|nr:ribosomal RNA small subunit methyltransferase A [Blastocatellia bacterium]